MIIKKFQGKTKEEAMECAKKELGEGIVEMNVKTVKAKGLLGVFKGTKIEVTVAKEEESEKYGIAYNKAADGVKVSLSTAGNAGKIIPMKQPAKLASGQGAETVMEDPRMMGETVADVLAAFPQAMKKTTGSTEAVVKASESRKSTTNTETVKSSILEEKLDNLHSLLEQQLQNRKKLNLRR